LHDLIPNARFWPGVLIEEQFRKRPLEIARRVATEALWRHCPTGAPGRKRKFVLAGKLTLKWRLHLESRQRGNGSPSTRADGGVRRELRQLCIGYRSLGSKSSATAAFPNGVFTLSPRSGHCLSAPITVPRVDYWKREIDEG
jgi:hypothetical protein